MGGAGAAGARHCVPARLSSGGPLRKRPPVGPASQWHSPPRLTMDLRTYGAPRGGSRCRHKGPGWKRVPRTISSRKLPRRSPRQTQGWSPSVKSARPRLPRLMGRGKVSVRYCHHAGPRDEGAPPTRAARPCRGLRLILRAQPHALRRDLLATIAKQGMPSQGAGPGQSRVPRPGSEEAFRLASPPWRSSLRQTGVRPLGAGGSLRATARGRPAGESLTALSTSSCVLSAAASLIA